MTSILRGLYAITDDSLIAEKNFTRTIEQALSGGVNVIQHRDKSGNIQKRLQQARDIKLLCEKYDTTFIINDDIDLAKKIDADGVHIGVNDSSYKSARKKLGSNKIIGVTCYNQFDSALQAQNLGADYVAFGSFFSSSVKPDTVVASKELLVRAKQELSVPVCAIGGITLDNSVELIDTGVDMLAVITGVFGADDIQSACKEFSALFIAK